MSTEGFITFTNSQTFRDADNSTEELIGDALLAPMWDNLRTDGPGDDIFIHDSGDGDDVIDGGADDDRVEVYGDLLDANRWVVERQHTCTTVSARVTQTNLLVGAVALTLTGIEAVDFIGGDGGDVLNMANMTQLMGSRMRSRGVGMTGLR